MISFSLLFLLDVVARLYENVVVDGILINVVLGRPPPAVAAAVAVVAAAAAAGVVGCSSR